ncbi:flagellin [Methylobacterium sp. E-005]|uniref:flagellin n=1 Tax=Methylobacterium sp. E-005 TaxID=2836549 RepID=UPI001FBA48ED|nr:flagellin [Methylobacterium sp. E-005]MCJ2085474.1 flagellin [Methylobacterium sp. E-005]
MTTITPFAAGSYTTTRNTTQLLALKNQLNTLSTQLSTGLTAQTYGGLGTGRSTALSAQSTLSALTGYAAGITAAQTRTQVAVTSLTQVATLGSSTQTTLENGSQSTAVNSTASKTLAQNNLEAALDALNQSAGGSYLFGGSNTSTQPVVDADKILNGTTDSSGNTLAGLKTVVSEQVTADLGAGSNGRLTQTSPGGTTPTGTTLSTTQVGITEDTSARSTPAFGFALAGAPTTTGSALTTTYTPAASGSPASFTVNVATQPAVGDNMTLTLNLPDGTSTTLTLTAAAAADTNSTTSFAIGGDASATATNLSATLNNALKSAASSTLTASATARAATNFFSASGATVAAGTAPLRVTTDANGEPSYTPGKATDTVIWYQGEDGNSDPRSTQSVQVSATSTVQTGVRANETPIANVLAGLATVALGMPSSSDTNATAIYNAVSSRAQTLLSSTDTSPSVQDTVTELSLASTRLSNAATTNTATQNTLQNTLDGIEQAPTEEVATKLLDLQNRLQASYQITASLSKLSLVNYIS